MTIGGNPNLESLTDSATITIQKEGDRYFAVADIKIYGVSAAPLSDRMKDILKARDLQPATVERMDNGHYFVRIASDTRDKAVNDLIHLGSIITGAKVDPVDMLEGEPIIDLVTNVAKTAPAIDTVVSEARVVLRNSGVDLRNTGRA